MLFIKNKFLQISLFLILANIFSGLLGFVYQIIIGRLLDPTDFAKFSAIISLLVLFNSPLVTLLTITSKEVANLNAINLQSKILSLYNLIRKIAFYNIFPLAILLLFTSNIWLEIIKLDSNIELFLLFLLFYISPFCFINLGILQGVQSYKWYALTYILEIFLKIIICVILIHFGFSLTGALCGVLLAMYFSQLISNNHIKAIFSNTDKNNQNIFTVKELFKIYTKYWPLLIGNICLIIITQSDILFVNWYFSSSEASVFAVNSILGKTVLYLPSAIITAALPMFVNKVVKNENPKQLFLQSIFYSFLLCTVMSILFFMLQDTLIPFLFGYKYLIHDNLLGWYGISMIPFSIIMIIESSILAKGKFLFSWLYLFFCPLYIFFIKTYNDTLLSIIYINGLIGFSILLVGIIFMGLSKNKYV